MPNRRNPKVLQGLMRETRKNRLVYVIVAECRLVLPKAQAPQPDNNVHDGPQAPRCSIALSERAAEVMGSLRSSSRRRRVVRGQKEIGTTQPRREARAVLRTSTYRPFVGFGRP